MSKDKNQYWMCIMGPADPSKYKGNGADFPLRNSVKQNKWFINS